LLLRYAGRLRKLDAVEEGAECIVDALSHQLDRDSFERHLLQAVQQVHRPVVRGGFEELRRDETRFEVSKL
jgi:hypothetical protein